MKNIRLLVIAAALTVSASLSPLEPGTKYSTLIDWQSGTITIEMEKDVPASTNLTPRIRYDLETQVEHAMPEVFYQALASVNVDSIYTIAESITLQKVLLDKMRTLSESGDKTAGSISQDMKKIHTAFEYPFFGETGLVSCFIFHTTPIRIRHVLGIADTGQFTGLVIYAKGEYELYAKKGSGKLSKALFPAIYDDEMNLILSREMCDPAALKKRGMALYTNSMEEKKFSERIGVAPLHTMAAALFGINNTDIILPAPDVEKLCATAESRKILLEGRILIITD